MATTTQALTPNELAAQGGSLSSGPIANIAPGTQPVNYTGFNPSGGDPLAKTVAAPMVSSAKDATSDALNIKGVLDQKTQGALTQAANNQTITQQQLTQQQEDAQKTADQQKIDAQKAAETKTAQDQVNATNNLAAAATGSSTIQTAVYDPTTGQLTGYKNNTTGEFTPAGGTATTTTGGTNVTPTVPIDLSTPEGLQQATQQLVNTLQEGNKQFAQLANGTYPLTPDQQAALGALQKNWDLTIQAQQGANKTYASAAGMAAARRGGEYDPMGTVAEVQRAMQVGINAINREQAAETEALYNMRQGFEDSNFNRVTSAYKAMIENDKNIYSAIKDMYDATEKAKQQAIDNQDKINTEYYNQVTKPIEDTLSTVTANGAPQSVKDAVKNATTVQGAIDAAGDWLQQGTGIVGEYLYYKRQAEGKNQVPMDFNTYQTVDANRKATAAAIASGSYTQGDNPAVDSWVTNIRNGAAKLSDVPAALKSLVSVGLADAGGSSDQLNDIIDQTASALGDINPDTAKGFHGAIGTNLAEDLTFGLVKRGTPGFQSAGYLANLKKFKDLLTLPNLNLLKGMGRVTDREFRTLQDALTSLSPDMPESQFRTEYNKVKTILDEKKNDIKNPTAGQIATQESQAKDDIVNYGAQHPELRTYFTNLVTKNDPTLGRPMTYQEAYDYAKATGKIK